MRIDRIILCLWGAVLLFGFGCATVPPAKPPTVSGGAILIRTDSDAAQSSYKNLKLGVPRYTDVVLDRAGYAIGYSYRYKQPLWVAYYSTAAELKAPPFQRRTDFRADPAIPDSATPADYRNSGYDRGHLAPARDMAYSAVTLSESFLLTNMSPQAPKFNRGVWSRLEAAFRGYVLKNSDAYIVTGPIFYAGKPVITIGSGVAVPHAYYKVIFTGSGAHPKAIGYILSPTANQKLSACAVSVDAVERATGLDFFNRLPDRLENQVEAQRNLSDWP